MIRCPCSRWLAFHSRFGEKSRYKGSRNTFDAFVFTNCSSTRTRQGSRRSRLDSARRQDEDIREGMLLISV